MSNLNNPNLEPFLRKFDGQVVSKEPTATDSFIEKVDAEVVEDQPTTKPQNKPKGEVAVESLIRPRKDKLVQIIGDIYDFKLNTITGKIELNGKPISGNFLRTFYLELAERNNLDVKETNAS